LIGTSIALALKTKGIAIQMVDKQAQSERLANDLVSGEVISDPDLVIVSASIGVNLKLILEALKSHPRSIVLDIASVKSNLLDEVTKLSDNPENFISSHPMAGREVSGAQSARSDLFVGRAWIGITSPNTSELAKELLTELVSFCRSSLYWLSAKEHDQTVAAISHLPQILSTALAYTLDKKGVESIDISGQGLRDLLRLSGSNPKLWSDLLFANKESLDSYLSDMNQSISAIEDSLVNNDRKTLEDIFTIGNKVYESYSRKTWWTESELCISSNCNSGSTWAISKNFR
jgi:prephenate dehydrogenase